MNWDRGISGFLTHALSSLARVLNVGSLGLGDFGFKIEDVLGLMDVSGFLDVLDVLDV